MHSDFNSVEAELREINADFASGRMNAFGSAQAQDAVLRELKHIAEIETQVFYKTCSILKSGNTADHTLLTDVFASAQPPPQGRSTSTAGGSRTNRSASTGRGGRDHVARAGSLTGSPDASGGGGADPTSRFSWSLGSGSLNPEGPLGTGDKLGSRSRLQQEDGETISGPAPHIKSTEWCNETGFPDKAFEDVAERFRSLESDFSVLGNQLRQISKHVVQLNIVSEEMNRSSSGGDGDSESNGGGGNGNHNNYDSDDHPFETLPRSTSGYGDGASDGMGDDNATAFNRTVYRK